MTDLVIIKGSTFSRVLRWEAAPLVSTAITAITKAAPAVITSAAHGLVDGWRAAIVSAGGMRQINAKNYPPRTLDFHKVTYIGATQVSMNDVNSTNYSAYTSGGFLVSYTPVSLSGFTARMMIRLTAETADPALVSLVSPGDIVLDDTYHTITITMTAAATAALAFATGAYDLELVSGAGVVTKLISGNVFVTDEVTR